MESPAAIIEINEDEIKVLWVARRAGLGRSRTLTIVNYDRIPLPTGVVVQGAVSQTKELTELLRAKCWRTGRRRLISAYLLISAQQGFVRAFDLPWIAAKNRAAAIGFLIDEEVPISEEVLADWLTLHEDRNANLWRVLVGAGKRRQIEQYVQCLSEAGWRVQAVDFIDTALGLALSSGQGQQESSQGLDKKIEERILYLEVAERGLYVGIFRGAWPEFVRTLSAGYLVDKDMADWSEEILRLVYYNSMVKHPEALFSKIIVAGDWRAGALGAELQARGVAPYLEVKDASLPIEIIGYGQRLVGGKRGLDIWRPVIKGIKNRQAVRLASGLLALGILAGLGTSFFWLQTERQLINDVRILAEQGAEIELQSRKQLELQASWAELRQNPWSIGSELKTIQGLEQYGVELTKIEYLTGRIYIQGSAEKAKDVENVLGALPRYGWVHPYLSHYQQDGTNRIEFALEAERKE